MNGRGSRPLGTVGMDVIERLEDAGRGTVPPPSRREPRRAELGELPVVAREWAWRR